MSVEDNVEYGLRVKRIPKDERRDRASDALAMVQLSTLADRRPA
jgi:ABC-type Fe3+/spermidine/putrescine transport system ATPase subunit